MWAKCRVCECYSRWYIELPECFKCLEVAEHKWVYVISISYAGFMILFGYFTFLHFIPEEGGKDNIDSC
jgi:hypothetical protein